MAAAAAAKSKDSAVVAAAAAAGGFGGYMLWYLIQGKRENSMSPDSGLRAVEATLRPEEIAYGKEVEKWTIELAGGKSAVSPVLLLAAKAHKIEKATVRRSQFPGSEEGHSQWKAALKQQQEMRVKPILAKAGWGSEAIARVTTLLSMDGSREDKDMQVLEDATCLVFLQTDLPSMKIEDHGKLVDLLHKTWVKMSPCARSKAIHLEYDAPMLHCLIEAIARDSTPSSPQTPMVAPRFTKACADLLRKSWSELPETFTKEVFERVLAEDKEVYELLSHPVVKEFQNMRKVISRFLGLLEPEAMPQFEKLAHALAVAGHCGGLRLSHIAAMKRAVVRVVTSNASKQQRESVNRAWEAFFYALGAVVAPHLMSQDRLEEIAAATSTALPVPGGGPHAAIAAVNGVALLEMSLNISALRPGSNAPPEEVMTKLREARGWLLDCIREDVNAYCGLLSSVYGQMPDKAMQAAASEETEKRLWLRRAAEVPLRVAELSTGTAAECLRCKSYIKASLKGDWIAGAKLLRTASEISLKNVSINLRDMGLAAKAADFDKRLARIRDTEPPWEDLVDVTIS